MHESLREKVTKATASDSTKGAPKRLTCTLNANDRDSMLAVSFKSVGDACNLMHGACTQGVFRFVSYESVLLAGMHRREWGL